MRPQPAPPLLGLQVRGFSLGSLHPFLGKPARKGLACSLHLAQSQCGDKVLRLQGAHRPARGPLTRAADGRARGGQGFIGCSLAGNLVDGSPAAGLTLVLDGI